MPDQLYLLSAALSTLADTAYAALVGLLLARWWLNKATTPEPTTRPILSTRGPILAIALYTFAHLCRPWFLAAGMSGSSAFHDNLILIPDILTSTHQGKLWFYISASLFVLWLLTLVRQIPFLTILSLTAIAFAKAASSHAGGDGDFTLTTLVQTLHILATAVWAGSILISGLLVLPRLSRNSLARTTPLEAPPNTIWQYGSYLSQAATISIGIVLLSGLFTGYRELNAPLATLLTTPWGKILLTKIFFVLLALALGAASRFLCLGRECNHPNRRLFSRLLFAEAIAMIAILALSGLLGNTSPPM